MARNRRSAWTRWLHHLWLDAADVRRRLDDAAMARLAERVAASERRHRGEIRLAIEGGLPWSYLRQGLDARARAVTLFGKLRVWDTEHNNGVLIYLLLADHAIEIVVDRGLARQTAGAAWEAVVDGMRAHFRAGRFEAGLAAAIDAVDTLLVSAYPLEIGSPETDRNELPDTPWVR